MKTKKNESHKMNLIHIGIGSLTGFSIYHSISGAKALGIDTICVTLIVLQFSIWLFTRLLYSNVEDNYVYKRHKPLKDRVELLITRSDYCLTALHLPLFLFEVVLKIDIPDAAICGYNGILLLAGYCYELNLLFAIKQLLKQKHR